nr:hypothetical protein GCM10025732_33260 [Glycomyces mayteni]
MTVALSLAEGALEAATAALLVTGTPSAECGRSGSTWTWICTVAVAPAARPLVPSLKVWSNTMVTVWPSTVEVPVPPVTCGEPWTRNSEGMTSVSVASAQLGVKEVQPMTTVYVKVSPGWTVSTEAVLVSVSVPSCWAEAEVAGTSSMTRPTDNARTAAAVFRPNDRMDTSAIDDRPLCTGHDSRDDITLGDQLPS